jgi:hypothetical protein
MKSLVATVSVSMLLGSYLALAQQSPAPHPSMNFFGASRPIGDGGNLGGLAGADAHCQALAAAVGAGRRTWHAYLSWNSSHATTGCSQAAFEKEGGAGLFYCFAIN